jgi:NAD(P)-dependent dehydrogenase (short-subunit alcohol dehydrogenase family)
MRDKPVALVTGANQGIGLQIAKDLVSHGFTLLVGSRNLERGEAAAKEVGHDPTGAPARRDGSGFDRRRRGAYPERVRTSRRPRQQRGYLEYE